MFFRLQGQGPLQGGGGGITQHIFRHRCADLAFIQRPKKYFSEFPNPQNNVAKMWTLKNKHFQQVLKD